MDSKPEFNYIGQCPVCAAYCMVCVDDPNHRGFTAKYVAKMVNEGLTVTRVDNDFVRANFGHCDCKSKKKKKDVPQQLELF